MQTSKKIEVNPFNITQFLRLSGTKWRWCIQNSESHATGSVIFAVYAGDNCWSCEWEVKGIRYPSYEAATIVANLHCSKRQNPIIKARERLSWIQLEAFSVHGVEEETWTFQKVAGDSG